MDRCYVRCGIGVRSVDLCLGAIKWMCESGVSYIFESVLTRGIGLSTRCPAGSPDGVDEAWRWRIMTLWRKSLETSSQLRHLGRDREDVRGVVPMPQVGVREDS